MRPSWLRRVGTLAVAGAVLASGLTGVAVLTAPTTAAAVPGNPGVPSDPTVLFEEDFENRTADSNVLLTDYTGASGMTYTADPLWGTRANCNGFIINQTSPMVPGDCNSSESTYFNLTALPYALGQLAGSATPQTNAAAASYTSAVGDDNQIQFATETPLTLPTANRFVTFSVDTAAVNCTSPDNPELRFYLQNDQGAEIPVSDTAINPCTDPRATTVTSPTQDGRDYEIQVGSFAADSSLLLTGGTLGIVLRNEDGGGAGNDGAYDNIRVLDVTPQLDKDFDPERLYVGESSTLTFTVTNTSELAAKAGWSFTDALPEGLTIAEEPNVGGSCDATTTAGAGGSTIEVVDGNLAAGEVSCTISVDVTSATADAYVNGPDNVTTVGLEEPGNAPVEFIQPADIPEVSCTSDPAIFNTGYVAETGGVAADGAMDERWMVAGGSTGVFGVNGTTPDTLVTLPPADTFYEPAEVGKINTAWDDTPYGNAQWISANYNASQNQDTESYGDWYYRYQFSLDEAVDPAQFSITMNWLADNTVSGVWVNNEPQEGENLPQFDTDPYRGPGFSLENAARTTLEGDWQTGLNTMLVQMKSYYPAEGFVAQVDPTALCADLAVEKTSDADENTRIGDTVTYSVTATNTGEGAFTEEFPATFSDDLTGVVDDATFNDDASADVDGEIVYDEPKLSWTGALGAGESVTLTYSVALTGDGDGVVRNVAYSGTPDTATPVCDPPTEEGTDPDTGVACAENEFEVPRLRIEKSADTSELPAVGDTVTYTVTATNEGPGVYTEDAPAVVVDDMSDVLDDAEFVDDSITTSTGEPATFADGRLGWEGALGAGESVTITYQVTYTAAGDARLTNVAWQPGDPTDPTPEPPVCDPRHADGTDPVTGEACGTVTIPAGQYTVTKDVDPEDGSTVAAGQELTYTITFDSTGTAAADIDTWVDDLSGVLDDAEIVTAPTASDAALTVSEITGGAFTVSGTIPPGESYTVSYSVRVLPDGERGDDTLGNVVFQDGTTPPEDCAEGDPLCTVNLIPQIVDAKSVDPESGSTVRPGQDLTYTLTFTNEGTGAGTVDRVDDLTSVLDDADVTVAPTASDDALTVSEVADGQFSIAGELAAGQTVTVSYTVTVKAMDELGDTELGNFLLDPGTPPPGDPSDCAEGDEDCTYNPVPRLEDSKSVDPESGSTVQSGQVLTYTLTFENTGTVPVVVDRADDLTHVLDDADVTVAPAASDPALAVSEVADGQLAITGELAVGQTVTVSYAVTVKAADELGDAAVANFLLDPGTPPPSDPSDCAAGDVDCTYNPVPEIVDSKSVDPASNTAVRSGQELTYTLTFENLGEAAGMVDRVDDLTHVLDDAEVTTMPVASDDALAVSEVADGRFAITGELAAGQTVTVTYTVTVKAAGELGDTEIANFLIDPGTPPPADPVCTDGEDCTFNPVSDVVVTKTADPASGTEVEVGQDVAYTLTFENAGAVAESIDYTDHMDGVLDDADLTKAPAASDEALAVSEMNDGSFSVAGELAAGQTVTVTYTVTVRDWAEQEDHTLGNVVAVTGQEPPADCSEGSMLCTEHPVEEPPAPATPSDPSAPATPSAPPLAATGGDIANTVLLSLLGMLILGGGAILVGRGRRGRASEGDEIG